jgi:hypothetical protein
LSLARDEPKGASDGLPGPTFNLRFFVAQGKRLAALSIFVPLSLARDHELRRLLSTFVPLSLARDLPRPSSASSSTFNLRSFAARSRQSTSAATALLDAVFQPSFLCCSLATE